MGGNSWRGEAGVKFRVEIRRRGGERAVGDRAARSHDGDPLRGHVGSGAEPPPAVPPGLPALADAAHAASQAGQQQQPLAQQHGHRQGQRHGEAGRQVEAVRLLLEGPAPAVEQRVQRADEQGDVAQRRLGRGGRGLVCRPDRLTCLRGGGDYVCGCNLSAGQWTNEIWVGLWRHI